MGKTASLGIARLYKHGVESGNLHSAWDILDYFYSIHEVSLAQISKCYFRSMSFDSLDHELSEFVQLSELDGIEQERLFLLLHFEIYFRMEQASDNLALISALSAMQVGIRDCSNEELYARFDELSQLQCLPEFEIDELMPAIQLLDTHSSLSKIVADIKQMELVSGKRFGLTRFVPSAKIQRFRSDEERFIVELASEVILLHKRIRKPILSKLVSQIHARLDESSSQLEASAVASHVSATYDSLTHSVCVSFPRDEAFERLLARIVGPMVLESMTEYRAKKSKMRLKDVKWLLVHSFADLLSELSTAEVSRALSLR